MKSISILLLFAFSAFHFTLLAVGVEKDDVVGTWRLVEIDDPEAFPLTIEEFVMTFSETNSFTLSATLLSKDKRIKESRSGTYSIDQGKLTTHTKEEDLSEVYDVKIVEKNLLLHIPDSATMTLKKEQAK